MQRVHDIFAMIEEHQISGMMLHEQMADFYDFLNLHGFKRMHEYRFLCESRSMRMVHRYFINHYNMLILRGHPSSPDAIPSGWGAYTRQQVTQDVRRRAVRDGIAKWDAWERETKKLYETAYKELCDLGEIAASEFILQLVLDVDKELKYVDRLHINLESIEYDMSAIYLMQDELHEKYRKKAKSVGVDIC